MTVAMDQFDGEFIHTTARDMRHHDVILVVPARSPGRRTRRTAG